jgi:Putative serine esterase (DUF676)
MVHAMARVSPIQSHILSNKQRALKTLLRLSVVFVSSCGPEAMTPPTLAVPAARQYSLRVVLSPGVTASLIAGERMLDSGTSVAYAVSASSLFTNPNVYIDGLKVPLTGTIRVDKAREFVASADSLLTWPRSDSVLIGDIAQLIVGGDEVALSQRLTSMSDSLALHVPSDTAARIFARILSRAIVPERDAAMFLRALEFSARATPQLLIKSDEVKSHGDAIHTEIVYVNGIMTSPGDFELTWRGALRPIARRAGLTTASGFDVSAFYNRTAAIQDMKAAEFFMCVRLKWLQVASGISSALLSVPGCFPVGGIAVGDPPIPVGDFAEALQQMINLSFVNGNPALVAIDAVRLADSVRVELSRGKRILFVAHSQGNLLVSEALSYLRARADFRDTDFRCIGWVSIAPPRTPTIPVSMNSPSAFIVRGQKWADVLDPILRWTAGNESVVRLPNSLSDTFDGSSFLAYALSGQKALSIGSILHSIASSYLGMPETELATKEALTVQVGRLNQSCPTASATIEIVSNLPTSWSLEPNAITGSGITGSHIVRPAGSGSVFTIVPASLAGRSAVTTNSDGGGASMSVAPGQTKRFSIAYSGSPSVAPSVSSLLPSSMIADNTLHALTISGADFQTGNIVQFKWAAGDGAGVWTTSPRNPPSIVNPGLVSISMNPGLVSDVINVRVCRSALQATTTDCSSGSHAIVVTAPSPAPVAPTVNLVTPSNMVANNTPQMLVVRGTNFRDGNIVQFKWTVGDRAGAWNDGTGNPPAIASPELLSIMMNPASASDVISVRVCRSASQTSQADCSSGVQSVTVTAPAPLAPSVSFVTPTAMPANTTNSSQLLTVAGENFQVGNVVQFKWGVGRGAGVWTLGAANPPTIATPTLLSVNMFPGAESDIINVRVCRAVAEALPADCSSGIQFVTVTAPAVPPAAPTLITPGAPVGPGPRLTTLTPAFVWTAVPSATGYGLYIRDLTTNALVYDNDSVGNITTLSPVSLIVGHAYRWNMRARNAAGAMSDYSIPFFFSR